jgi:hypothetical protein
MRVTDRSEEVPGRRWLRLYPRDWRDRYEDEMLAILEGRSPGSWLHLDLARGMIDAHTHPLRPSTPPVLAALVTGVAWVVTGLASVTQPLMPDWPGYMLEALPVAVVGAVAGLRAVSVFGLRSGLDAPRSTMPAVVTAVLGHVAWIAALAIAALGGPYGAITGAAGSVAAVGTVLIGLTRYRAGDHPAAEGLVLAGGAMLVPSPISWIAAGAAWIGVAVSAARVVRPLRPA